MQETQQKRSTHGAKAMALNEKATIARYRLILLISLLLAAIFELGIHLILGH